MFIAQSLATTLIMRKNGNGSYTFYNCECQDVLISNRSLTPQFQIFLYFSSSSSAYPIQRTLLTKCLQQFVIFTNKHKLEF